MNAFELLVPQPQEIPENLYHYTSASGFFGIVTNKTLWGTNCHHLNDTQEFIYACKLLGDVLDNVLSTRKLPASPIMELHAQLLKGGGQSMRSVISFTEHPDQLSQWRAYGKDSGYALSFDAKQIIKLATKSGWRLVKCIYDEEEMKSIFEGVIIKSFGEPLQRVGPEVLDVAMPPSANTHHIHLLNFLNEYALCFKHPGFVEEQEWRLISPEAFRTQMQFRVGANGIIPYLELSLADNETKHPCINGVIVSPRTDTNIAISTANDFLYANGIWHHPPYPSNVSAPGLAIKSNIPYR